MPAREIGDYHTTVSRVLIAMVAAIAALFVSTGNLSRSSDNDMILVLVQDQDDDDPASCDTFLNCVFPLTQPVDLRVVPLRQRHLQRGRCGADAVFEGTLELVTKWFPVVAGCGHHFSYSHAQHPCSTTRTSTPRAPGFNPLGSVNVPRTCSGCVRSVGRSGNGPGIQEVPTFSVAGSGPHGKGGGLQRAWHG